MLSGGQKRGKKREARSAKEKKKKEERREKEEEINHDAVTALQQLNIVRYA